MTTALWARTQRTLQTVLLVALCYAAADLTAARIERRLQIPPKPIETTASNTGLVGTTPGLSRAADLLFTLSTTKPVAGDPSTAGNGTTGPNGEPQATPAPPPVPPPKLTGTMAGGGHSLAVLQFADDTKVAGVGEQINGYWVEDVGPYSCRLRDTAGQIHNLTMELANAGLPGGVSPPPTAPTPPQAAPSPVVPAPDGPLSVKELRDMLDHAQDFASHIQVRAVRRNDEVFGMQVSYDIPNNPFARLGVNHGDIVTSLNGHPLKGPEDLNWAYQELRNSSSLNFQLERNGQPMPLTINLVEN